MAKNETTPAPQPSDELTAGVEGLRRLEERLSGQLHQRHVDQVDAAREKLRPSIEKAKAVLPILDALKAQRADELDYLVAYDWSQLRRLHVPEIDKIEHFVKEARQGLYTHASTLRRAIDLYEGLNAAGIKERVHLEIAAMVRDPDSRVDHLHYCLNNVAYRLTTIREFVKDRKLEPAEPVPAFRPPAPPMPDQAGTDFSVFA